MADRATLVEVRRGGGYKKSMGLGGRDQRDGGHPVWATRLLAALALLIPAANGCNDPTQATVVLRTNVPFA